MLAADLMEAAYDATLQQRPKIVGTPKCRPTPYGNMSPSFRQPDCLPVAILTEADALARMPANYAAVTA